MASKAPGSIKVERSSRMNTIKGRAGYPHVFKPTAFQEGDEPKYSVILMVPKVGADDFIKQLKALRVEATKKLYPAKRPAMFEEYGITDGDEKLNADGEADDSTAGFWLVKASTKNKPAVIDKEGTAILDELEIYGGCWVRLNICAKAYGTPSKGGVALELNVCQKVSDGDPFSGAAKATKQAVNEMGAYEEEAEEY